MKARILVAGAVLVALACGVSYRAGAQGAIAAGQALLVTCSSGNLGVAAAKSLPPRAGVKITCPGGALSSIVVKP